MKLLLKPIFFILFITSSLFCDTVSFKEGKYVEALDIFTYRDGNVSYSDEQTIIKYQDGKIITKKDNNLTVHNKSGELLTTIQLNKRVEISLYFKLTKALFLKDFKSLEENFEIKEFKEKNYLFLPKDNIKNVIEEITLTLNQDETPKEFSINFGNGDIIKIETK
jgi:hypothetical protein